MNGTTRCPLCDTRFKITQAQLNAHGGMVRCGHCRGAFDARAGYTPDQPAETAPVPAAPEYSGSAAPDQAIAEQAAESAADAQSIVDTSDTSGIQHESTHPEHDESPLEFQIDRSEFCANADDILQVAVTENIVEAQPADSAPERLQDLAPPSEIHDTPQINPDAHPAEIHDTPRINPDAHPVEHIVMLDDDKLVETASTADASPEHVEVKPRRWPWLAGIGLSMMLLLAQSVFLFRVELASHLPALKPALIGFCDALGCSVPLPKDVDAISIESSGLDADPLHENIITLNALLRNRADSALAFPSIALTLNDNHDKLLARRFILPAEYLPSGEKELSGFAANHEIIVKLRLDTADLKPSGYRIELFYGRVLPAVTNR